MEVFGLKEISHVLWLGMGILVVVPVVMRMGVFCWAYVVHLVRGAALHASRLRLITGESDPKNAVGVGRVTSASNILLVTGRVDNNGVLWSAYMP